MSDYRRKLQTDGWISRMTDRQQPCHTFRLRASNIFLDINFTPSSNFTAHSKRLSLMGVAISAVNPPITKLFF